jgi:hypothetical protein
VATRTLYVSKGGQATWVKAAAAATRMGVSLSTFVELAIAMEVAARQGYAARRDNERRIVGLCRQSGN